MSDSTRRAVRTLLQAVVAAVLSFGTVWLAGDDVPGWLVPLVPTLTAVVAAIQNGAEDRGARALVPRHGADTPADDGGHVDISDL